MNCAFCRSFSARLALCGSVQRAWKVINDEACVGTMSHYSIISNIFLQYLQEMRQLNLPAYSLSTKVLKGIRYVHDPIRKKYVQLTPEEWVRQHLVHFLINEKHVPKGLMAVEMKLEYNKMLKRSDIVVYARNGHPLMIVECKAPTVPINQKVFEQIAMYNLSLQVPFLIVSNGMDHYCCRIDLHQKSFVFLQEFPDYREFNAE